MNGIPGKVVMLRSATIQIVASAGLPHPHREQAGWRLPPDNAKRAAEPVNQSWITRCKRLIGTDQRPMKAYT